MRSSTKAAIPPALASEGRRLEAVLNNASVAIFLMDDRQYCVYMNRAAEALTGWNLTEVLELDRPLHDIIHHTHPDGRPFPLHECAIDRAFPERAQMQGEETFVHRDGSFYPVSYTASPVRDEASRTVGTVIEVRGIAAEKQLEERLKLQLELSERLRSARSPREAMERAAATIASRLGAAIAGFSEVDRERQEYVVEWVWPLGENGPMVGRHPMGTFDLGTRFHEAGETLVMEDVETAPDLGDAMREAVRGLGVRSGLSVPIMDQGRLIATFFIHHPDPRVWSPEEVRLVEDAASRSWEAVERARAEAALRESEARQRAINEGTPECIKIVASDGRLLHMNAAGVAMIEAPDFASVRDADTFQLIAPEHRQAWLANHRRVLAGESLSWEFDVIALRGTRRSMETHAVPLRLPDGSVVQLATTRDVSERKRAEERQRLLINELNHRVKNTLAIVQGLAQQTFKGADVPGSARGAFESRLAALAAAHDLLTSESWESAPLGVVIARAAGPAAGPAVGRLELEGPDLLLTPQLAVSLTLAVHELATNAVKYGALSRPDGRVRVSWSVASDSRLRIAWEESGGPPVAPPERRGFGSRLIERSIASDFRGRVDLDYRPEGLVCTIEAPLPEPA